MYVSQRGEMGVGSSKEIGDKFGVVVGKVINTQIQTTISMKPITSTSTKKNMRALTKGISINEGARGTSSVLEKSNLNVDPKDKGR